GSARGNPARFAITPIATTTDEAASDLACQALAVSMVDFTRLAIFIKYLNKSSLQISANSATYRAKWCTTGIKSGFCSFLNPAHIIPRPTDNNSTPINIEAAVSNLWWP